MTESVIQMGIALALVLFLIFVFAFIQKKRLKSSGLISLVAYHSFGNKTGVAALKIGKEILIVGITPTDFKLLKTFDEKNLEQEEIGNIMSNVERLKKIKEGLNG